MSEDSICTIHQRVLPDGRARAALSEVRLPNGQVIPGVQEIHVSAAAGDGWWETTIKIQARFGDPIRLASDCPEYQKRLSELASQALVDG